MHKTTEVDDAGKKDQSTKWSKTTTSQTQVSPTSFETTTATTYKIPDINFHFDITERRVSYFLTRETEVPSWVLSQDKMTTF